MTYEADADVSGTISSQTWVCRALTRAVDCARPSSHLVFRWPTLESLKVMQIPGPHPRPPESEVLGVEAGDLRVFLSTYTHPSLRAAALYRRWNAGFGLGFQPNFPKNAAHWFLESAVLEEQERGGASLQSGLVPGNLPDWFYGHTVKRKTECSVCSRSFCHATFCKQRDETHLNISEATHPPEFRNISETFKSHSLHLWAVLGSQQRNWQSNCLWVNSTFL